MGMAKSTHYELQCLVVKLDGDNKKGVQSATYQKAFTRELTAGKAFGV